MNKIFLSVLIVLYGCTKSQVKTFGEIVTKTAHSNVELHSDLLNAICNFYNDNKNFSVNKNEIINYSLDKGLQYDLEKYKYLSFNRIKNNKLIIHFDIIFDKLKDFKFI